MDTTLLVCEQCGGDNIQVKAWVNANTNEFINDASDGEGEDNWCTDCNMAVEFVSEDEKHMDSAISEVLKKGYPRT